MIESSYDPDDIVVRPARSACGSSCPRAARSTGCARTAGSTSAAIRCARRSRRWTTSQDLYQRFGDWQIALAAFNVGYGAMLRSIARYNTNDYYQLCELRERAAVGDLPVHAEGARGRDRRPQPRGCSATTSSRRRRAETWDEVAVPTSMSLAMIAQRGRRDRGRHQAAQPAAAPRPHAAGRGRLRRARARRREGRVREASSPSSQSEWDGYDAYVLAHGERFEDVATDVRHLARRSCASSTTSTREAELDGGTVLVVPRVAEADAREEQGEGEGEAARLGRRRRRTASR